MKLKKIISRSPTFQVGHKNRSPTFQVGYIQLSKTNISDLESRTPESDSRVGSTFIISYKL